jgi:hypothetical protein
VSSLAKIKTALETRLKAMASLLPTQWENSAFTPPSDSAYQSVHLLPAEPVSPSILGVAGSEMYREIGVMQVTLVYPARGGAGTALAKAEAIRDWFPRGSSFSYGGVTTVVSRTPRIGPAMFQDDRYVLPVSIPYFANIIP